MSLRVLNPQAELLNKSAALHMNSNAAKGLQEVLKNNLGPKDTIKMLVGGAGDIKLTKGFFYSNAEQEEKMVAAERRQVDERGKKIIELKNKVCSGNDKNLVVISQKGIDPPSLDLLARAGVWSQTQY